MVCTCMQCANGERRDIADFGGGKLALGEQSAKMRPRIDLLTDRSYTKISIVRPHEALTHPKTRTSKSVVRVRSIFVSFIFETMTEVVILGESS